jgi:hypothetical protein
LRISGELFRGIPRSFPPWIPISEVVNFLITPRYGLRTRERGAGARRPAAVNYNLFVFRCDLTKLGFGEPSPSPIEVNRTGDVAVII